MSAPRATRTLIAGLMCCAVLSLALRATGEQPPAKQPPAKNDPND